jgi:hypothetical protein
LGAFSVNQEEQTEISLTKKGGALIGWRVRADANKEMQVLWKRY